MDGKTFSTDEEMKQEVEKEPTFFEANTNKIKNSYFLDVLRNWTSASGCTTYLSYYVQSGVIVSFHQSKYFYDSGDKFRSDHVRTLEQVYTELLNVRSENN